MGRMLGYRCGGDLGCGGHMSSERSVGLIGRV